MLVCFTFFLLSHPLFGAEKIRIAVVDFENKAGHSYWWYDQLGAAAADRFVTELVKSGKFSVIEREKIQAVLDEQALGASGAVTPQTAAKLGSLLGVHLILTGAVTEFGISETGGSVWGKFGGKVRTARAVLDARLINVSTGEILFADNAESKSRIGGGFIKGGSFGEDFDSGEAGKVMAGAVEELAKQIAGVAGDVSAFGSTGKIIKVEGSKVWINVGANYETRVGDTFTVYHKGEELIDPDTGLSLGAEEAVVGQIMVTKVEAKFSVGELKSGTVEPGDIIRK